MAARTAWSRWWWGSGAVDGEGDNLAQVAGAAGDHDEPVESQRDAGAGGQAVVHGGQQPVLGGQAILAVGRARTTKSRHPDLRLPTQRPVKPLAQSTEREISALGAAASLRSVRRAARGGEAVRRSAPPTSCGQRADTLIPGSFIPLPATRLPPYDEDQTVKSRHSDSRADPDGRLAVYMGE